MNNKTILITGVAGFLGSHLADRMLALGHRVIGCDNLMGGYLDNIPKGVEFHEGDCCNIDFMVKVSIGCDIVFHTAATPHEGLSVFSPYFITNNIFQASVSTISAAIQNKVKRFVYCSSMARYGNQEYPFKEIQRPDPVDPYGIAKAAGEEVLKSLAPMNDMEWIVAVPHNIVGPRQRYDDPFRNVMSIMINRVLQGHAPIIYGDGSQMRCFSAIDDCVYCLEKLALDPDIKNDVFNIGPDEEFVTINQLAELIIEETGFVGKPIYMPDRPKEIKYATCDATKARNVLGYNTTTTLIESIRQTIAYIKFRGPQPFKYDYPLEIVNKYIPKTWSERLM
jgi:UDP-glucose 4-epimerase